MHTSFTLLFLLCFSGIAVRNEVQVRKRDDDDRFSDIGKEVIRSLKENWPHLKTTRNFGVINKKFVRNGRAQWNIRTDTLLLGKWLWPTPIGMIGRGHLLDSALCHDQTDTNENRTGACDGNFNLKKCSEQEDCEKKGKCQLVEATSTSPLVEPRRLCAGHSDELYDQMFRTMTLAGRFLDVATLSAMTGRFLAAFRNAITYLHNANAPTTIRIIMAPLGSSAEEVLRELTRDIGEATRLKVHVGFWRRGGWWNHAKIIAADGRDLFQGGHNLWDDHYLRASPIHDVSMVASGSVAIDAHNFLDSMWSKLCRDRMSKRLHHRIKRLLRWDFADIASFPKAQPTCPDPFETSEYATEEAKQIGVPTISVARKGGFNVWRGFKGGAADDALYTMFASARKSILCSLQDVGAMTGPNPKISLFMWPLILGAFAKAMQNGAHVYLILSNPNAIPDKTTDKYGYGWSLESVRIAFQGALERYSANDASERLCTQLHLATLRYDLQPTWPVEANATNSTHNVFGNHAKMYVVDDQLFYLGSQNLYSADLAEYGLIIDDREATKQVKRYYWDPLWRSSKLNKLSSCDTA
eukprot:TRINITY_DN4545_c0_g2_i2.p1 TRINITY_DN4545_c0_g2~~TRINITY_DN4545_c0_g2_i2.p1  ORF type:complete len:582 (-),score=53.06 TRINITY_DN4545_c0_g2_i2:71-1816(-)